MNLTFRSHKSKTLALFIILICMVFLITVLCGHFHVDTYIMKVKTFNMNTMQSEVVHSLKPKDIFKVKMRKDLMKIINPSDPKFALTINSTYLLENKDLCASVFNLTILVIVLSSPKHFLERNVIRKTWANDKLYSSFGVARTVFLLGTTSDTAIQEDIEKEFKMNGDIVQGPFEDSYHNLSHKSVMGYKWTIDRCKNAEYILKTDDDIVVNMFRVLENVVPDLSITKYHVNCLRIFKSQIIRETGNKVYVEPSQFKGIKRYQSYCNGQFVLMLNDIVPYLFESASKSPLFWIDDIFMYSIVMNNIPALKYKEITYGEYGGPGAKYFLFFWERNQENWRYVYRVINDANQMIDIWSDITSHYV